MPDDPILEAQQSRWRRTLEGAKDLPTAVGSESLAHKQLRYQRISQVLEGTSGWSIHDVGAGLGDYYAYLLDHSGVSDLRYSGSDLTAEYCRLARERFPDIVFEHRDIRDAPNDELYDLLVLSGIFHQKGDVSNGDWHRYLWSVVDKAYTMCRRAIVFNVLSTYADYYDPELYYADLGELLGLVSRELSRFVTLHADYPLFEATVTVFRVDEVKRRYNVPEVARYL